MKQERDPVRLDRHSLRCTGQNVMPPLPLDLRLSNYSHMPPHILHLHICPIAKPLHRSEPVESVPPLCPGYSGVDTRNEERLFVSHGEDIQASASPFPSRHYFTPDPEP